MEILKLYFLFFGSNLLWVCEMELVILILFLFFGYEIILDLDCVLFILEYI